MATIPIPPFLAHLPVDSRGYPVPFFVAKRGEHYDFIHMDERKQQQAIQDHLCHICGKELSPRQSWYVITGPTGYKNRVVSDPPMHKDCAAYALQVCPHLLYQKAERKDDGTGKIHPAMQLGKPDSIYLIAIMPFIHVQRVPGLGVFIHFKPTSYTEYIYVNNRLELKE